MTAVFETVLRMDIMGSVVILVALILRAVLPRMPRRIRRLLWLPVLVRLLCPVLPKAPLSLFQWLHWPAALPAISISVLPVPVGGTCGPETVADSPSADPQPPAAVIWLAGLAALALWNTLRSLKLHRCLREAVQSKGNIFRTDQIGTPFAFGVFRPRIYLPCDLPPQVEDLIVAHERAHIRRGDLVLQLATQVALCLHWFNPLIWLFAALSRRDMEQACDEDVVRRLGEEARRAYAEALLHFARRRAPAASAAFGQNSTKERIVNIMRYKKPGRGFLLVSLACTLLLGACGLTDPTVLLPGQTAQGRPEAAFPLSGGAHEVMDTGEEDELLLGEYRQAGIDIREDGWYFRNQRVRQLTDGIRSIIRFQHNDPLGTVDVRVIRAETHLPDGSVALLGPITELRLGSVTEDTSRSGSFAEEAPSASDNSADVAVLTEDGSVSTRITDRPGAVSVRTTAEEDGAAGPGHAFPTVAESAGSETELMEKTTEALSKLAPFGITFKEQNSGLTVFLRGERLCGLLDEGPEQTVFYGFDSDGDGPLGVVSRHADGTVAEVISVSSSDSSPF